jgi:phage terminase large subunit GpA-like protein
VLDPALQTLVLWWASDTGKTAAIISNVIGFCIDEEPSRIIGAYPVEKSAEAFSKEILQPMINASPALRGKVYEQKSRDAGNTIAQKLFPGGSITLITAGSASSFRQRRARFVFADEIDAMDSCVGNEGNPISLLFKRTEGYDDSIQILSSTATVKNRSNIEWWFKQGDQRKWFVPCRKCGHQFVLMWKDVDIPEGGKHRFEQAVILCPECGAEHNDRQRQRMIRDGVWKPTAPFSGVRSYWLNGLNSLFPAKKGYRHKLHQFAKDVHEAKHSNDPKNTVRVWVNTFLAETYEEAPDVKPEWQPLFDRRESFDLTRLPKEVVLVVAGADIQADRIEVCFIGLGKGEEMWIAEHQVFWGDPRMPEIYRRVEAQLIREFVRVDGARLKLASLGMDTGYAAAQRATYEWLRPRFMRRYFAMKGAATVDAEVVARKVKSKVDRVTLLHVGTNRIKTVIYNRATITTPEDAERSADGFPGLMHFADSLTTEWFKGLLCEESRSVFKAGQEYKQFALPDVVPEGGTKRNEPLDCCVLGLAAFYARGAVNWEAEEKNNLRTLVKQAQNGEQKKPARRGDSGFWNWR